MKKITKIIDYDKVTICEGRQVNLNDDLPSEIDLSKSEWEPNPYAKRLREQIVY